MSSSERRPVSSRWIGAAAVAAGLLLTAGCTVRPVYMSTKTQEAGNVDLSAITVSEVSGRVAQEVRNNLNFAFTGGKIAPPPRYILTLAVTSSEQRLGFVRDETAPSYQVSVQVSFELKAIADNHTLLRSISLGTASYDRSNQNFANERARVDAENRAAEAVADEIRLRLALAIAKDVPQGKLYVPKGPDLPAGGTPAIMTNSM